MLIIHSVIITFLLLYLKVRITQTLFIYGNQFGRRKRQLGGGPDFECTSFDNCGNRSFVGLSFDDLNITDSQREFCNNDTTCLYDLAITGDQEIARTSMIFAENITHEIEILRKCFIISTYKLS